MIGIYSNSSLILLFRAINDVIDHTYTGVFQPHVSVFPDVIKVARLLQLSRLLEKCLNIFKRK